MTEDPPGGARHTAHRTAHLAATCAHTALRASRPTDPHAHRRPRLTVLADDEPTPATSSGPSAGTRDCP